MDNKVTGTEQEGQKVDLGGWMLYYRLSGKEGNTPTVILESGYGLSSRTWKRVEEGLSTFARVLVYDRAGLGNSQRGDQPQHSIQNVANLRALLKADDIQPPYILVGHSYGGINARLFAHTYPEEVAGLVLVDTSHEDQEERMVPLLPEGFRKVYLSTFSQEGTREEFLESFEQLREVKGSLGDMPLTVISAGSQEYHSQESYRSWVEMHQELLQLSTNAKYLIAENSGHNIQKEQPHIIIQAVKEMLSQVAK